jgi:hypothetical protein
VRSFSEGKRGKEVRRLHNVVGGQHNEERCGGWGGRRGWLTFGGRRCQRKLGRWAEYVVGPNCLLV